jgi:hypothetical protein
MRFENRLGYTINGVTAPEWQFGPPNQGIQGNPYLVLSATNNFMCHPLTIQGDGNYLAWDTTSALQVNGAVNFNDPSLTYDGINITSSGASIQIGSFAYATGDYSTALGYGASAGGDYSSAVGPGAYAGGDYSYAVGYGAYAGGDYSFAVGPGAYTNYSNSTVIGSDQSFSGNLNDNNAIGGITLGGYNPTISSGENWLMILPGTVANAPRVLIGASTVDDGTSALQVNGGVSMPAIASGVGPPATHNTTGILYTDTATGLVYCQ